GNNSSTTLAGAISGAGAGITKIGSGTWTLNGANTYTGLTTIASGIVQLGSAAYAPVLNNGGANITNGRLVFDYADTGSTPAAQVETALSSGKIHSSTATAHVGLGWVDNAGSSQVLVAPALFGDSDLSGTVDTVDFNYLAANFGKP